MGLFRKFRCHHVMETTGAFRNSSQMATKVLCSVRTSPFFVRYNWSGLHLSPTPLFMLAGPHIATVESNGRVDHVREHKKPLN